MRCGGQHTLEERAGEAREEKASRSVGNPRAGEAREERASEGEGNREETSTRGLLVNLHPTLTGPAKAPNQTGPAKAYKSHRSMQHTIGLKATNLSYWSMPNIARCDTQAQGKTANPSHQTNCHIHHPQSYNCAPKIWKKENNKYKTSMFLNVKSNS